MMLALLLSMAAVFSPAAVEAYSRYVGATVTVETENVSHIGILRLVTEEAVVIEVRGDVRTISTDDVLGIEVSGIERGPNAAFDPQGVRNRRIVELERFAERKDADAGWAAGLGTLLLLGDVAVGFLVAVQLGNATASVERKVGGCVVAAVAAGMTAWQWVGFARAVGDASAARSDIEALKSAPLPTSADEE
jgi:hypothetical protein